MVLLKRGDLSCEVCSEKKQSVNSHEKRRPVRESNNNGLLRSVFGVNGPEILLSQQMTMSSPSPNPNP